MVVGGHAVACYRRDDGYAVAVISAADLPGHVSGYFVAVKNAAAARVDVVAGVELAAGAGVVEIVDPRMGPGVGAFIGGPVVGVGVEVLEFDSVAVAGLDLHPYPAGPVRGGELAPGAVGGDVGFDVAVEREVVDYADGSIRILAQLAPLVLYDGGAPFRCRQVRRTADSLQKLIPFQLDEAA